MWWSCTAYCITTFFQWPWGTDITASLSSGAAAGPGLVPWNSAALPLDQNNLKTCFHLPCPSQPPAGHLGPPCRLLPCPWVFKGKHGGSCGVKNHHHHYHPLHGAVASVCSDTVRACYCPTSGCRMRQMVLSIHTLHVSGLFLLWTWSSLVLWTDCPPGTTMLELHSWRPLWVSPERDPGLCRDLHGFSELGTEEWPGLSSAAYEMNLSHGFSWSLPHCQIQKCLLYITASVPGITN